MTAEYLVVRMQKAAQPPCGMNCIIYVGQSERQAYNTFREAEPNRDQWNQPNVVYGVGAWHWNPFIREWVLMAWKDPVFVVPA